MSCRNFVGDAQHTAEAVRQDDEDGTVISVIILSVCRCWLDFGSWQNLSKPQIIFNVFFFFFGINRLLNGIKPNKSHTRRDNIVASRDAGTWSNTTKTTMMMMRLMQIMTIGGEIRDRRRIRCGEKMIQRVYYLLTYFITHTYYIPNGQSQVEEYVKMWLGSHAQRYLFNVALLLLLLLLLHTRCATTAMDDPRLSIAMETTTRKTYDHVLKLRSQAIINKQRQVKDINYIVDQINFSLSVCSRVKKLPRNAFFAILCMHVDYK